MTENDTEAAYRERAERAEAALQQEGSWSAILVEEGSSGRINNILHTDTDHTVMVYTDNPGEEGYGWGIEVLDQDGGSSLLPGGKIIELGAFLDIEGELVRRIKAAMETPAYQAALAITEGMTKVPMEEVPIGAEILQLTKDLSWIRAEVIAATDIDGAVRLRLRAPNGDEDTFDIRPQDNQVAWMAPTQALRDREALDAIADLLNEKGYTDPINLHHISHMVAMTGREIEAPGGNDR